MGYLLLDPELVAKEHYLLTVQIKDSSFKPGQFINIKTANGTDPLLRRPFSIFDADGDIAKIIIRVIGKGTSLISNMNPGEINVIGPSGNGFSMEKNKKILIIGGGVGNAPLFYLMKELKNNGNRITYIYCARSSDFVFEKNKYNMLADEFILTTDDGSDGIKGVATEVIPEKISMKNYDKIYCCGPDQMMEKVVKIAYVNTQVEVSVENYFGCGVGLCVGCTIDTVSGYRRACIDGPVFNGRAILWDKMPD